jgi:hypothetical protein
MCQTVIEVHPEQIFRWLKYNIHVDGFGQRCMPKLGIRIALALSPLSVTATRRCRSQWRPERLLDALRKRIDHGAFVGTFICPQEPAANECVYFAAVKFDRKTAKAGPTSRPATTHSLS